MPPILGPQITSTFRQSTSAVVYYGAPAVDGVSVNAYRLDAYEVTVARFRAFWSARATDLDRIRATPIAYPGGARIVWSGTATPPFSTATFELCNWSDAAGAREGHPINCVGWWAAQEFCVWDGGRLPTEAEWESAARGRTITGDGLTSERTYPWGEVAPTSGTTATSCDRAHLAPCPGENGGATRHVGRFAANAGVYDLAGNVWEWLADSRSMTINRDSCWSSRSNPLCMLAGETFLAAGGSWIDGNVSLRSATRSSAPAGFPLNVVGFRCARAR
jgi:formylglycine-generating enzyme required for sulfatase activity